MKYLRLSTLQKGSTDIAQAANQTTATFEFQTQFFNRYTTMRFLYVVSVSCDACISRKCGRAFFFFFFLG